MSADQRELVGMLVSKDGVVQSETWECVKDALLVDTWSLDTAGLLLPAGSVQWQQLAQAPIFVGYGEQRGGGCDRRWGGGTAEDR